MSFCRHLSTNKKTPTYERQRFGIVWRLIVTQLVAVYVASHLRISRCSLIFCLWEQPQSLFIDSAILDPCERLVGIAVVPVSEYGSDDGYGFGLEQWPPAFG